MGIFLLLYCVVFDERERVCANFNTLDFILLFEIYIPLVFLLSMCNLPNYKADLGALSQFVKTTQKDVDFCIIYVL